MTFLFNNRNIKRS